MSKPKRVLKKIPTFKSEDAEREFWATEDDGNMPPREEEIAEPLEDEPKST